MLAHSLRGSGVRVRRRQGGGQQRVLYQRPCVAGRQPRQELSRLLHQLLRHSARVRLHLAHERLRLQSVAQEGGYCVHACNPYHRRLVRGLRLK